jgi:hypothetical protein
MKIGVISDTHLKCCDDRLRRIVDTYFKDVELVIHAGDLISLEVLDAFAEKEVKAVSGNMDNEEARRALPDRLLVEVEGLKVGLIHGWGQPFGLEDKLKKKFDEIDCLVFGHTHRPCNKVKDGVLYFNPGSATDRLFTKLNTVGILEIGDGVKGKIVEVSL